MAPVLALLLCFLMSVAAVADGGQVRTFEYKDNVYTERLPNGLTLILKEVHSAPVVAVQAWIRFGSIDEEEKLSSGAAHYIEHMIFKGTPTRGVGEFDREIRGNGGELNAYTTFDHTTLHMTVADTGFDSTVAAMADVLANSLFDAKEAAKEKDVIVREIEGGLDDPDQALFRLFAGTLWRTHPRGLPVIGYLDNFLKLTRDDLYAFYKRYYVPNNCAVIIVGDFSIKEKLPFIRDTFAPWKRGEALAPRVPEEPWPTGVKEVETYHPAAESVRIQVGWPTCSMRDDDMYPLDVFAAAFGQGRTSRLYERLVVEESIVRSISAGNWTPDGHWGFFYVDAELYKPEDRARFLELLEEELGKAKQQGVAPEEMQRAVKSVEAAKVFSLATVSQQASSLGSGWLAGDLFFDDHYLNRLKQVTAQDITRAVDTYLGAEPRVIATLYPGEPPADPLAGAGTDAKQEAGGIIETTLDNGIRLVVKRNPEVAEAQVRVAFNAGTRFEPKGKEGINKFLAVLLDKGAGKRDAEALFKAIEDTGGSIGADGGRHSIYLQSRVLSRDLPLALELLSDMARSPRLDPQWIELMRKQFLRAIETKKEDTWSVNYDNLNKAMYKDHPYGRDALGTPESIGSITREDLLAYAAEIMTPDNCVIAVVGDVDPETVRAAVEKSFGSMKGTFSGPEVPPLPEPKAERVEEEMDGVNLSELIVAFPTVPMDHPDYYALEVVSGILGGMGSRLFTDMRDHQALAYSVGCFNNAGLEGGAFIFHISPSPHKSGELATYTAVIDRSIQSFLRHAADLAKTPISGEELEFAKANLIGTHNIDLQSNGSQALSIALDTAYGFPPDRAFHYAENIEAVTKEDIQRVAKQYFTPDHAVTAILRPAGAE